ncbi:uncharacterized protein B0I36DRAFT_46367 [Microdochium trichocladiopsis]|uniref:FluG domain-containing protein n=1 Tax=Microdochium trichocladiopsis TaxID=1682393 RepID=A0A9P8XTH0_9PEZI|nr:uncharacterized protein B0I36DRAFT_46367 [Microdochium trichocladiopsis]KAH7016456.1 hypothetical protein B0I36DRAFT_46367 [Microdochium trichocladiopsis]
MVKRSPEDYLRLARERGVDLSRADTDYAQLLRNLPKNEQRAMDRVLALWEGFKQRNEGASEREVDDCIEFIREVAMGIQGIRPDPSVEDREAVAHHPAVSTVIQYWKLFSRHFFLFQKPLGDEITKPVRKYIQTVLPLSFPMSAVKRPRRFATLPHFGHLAEQQWARDWHVYRRPSVRVYDWASLSTHISSSSRIGEYFESTCREGSGRGLRFKDVQFVVFYNEDMKPELGLRLVRDAKGMTYIPHARPQHVLYEGRKPCPLSRNGFLFHLAFLLARNAIEGHETIDTLLAVKPNPGEDISVIPWTKGIEGHPFYPNIRSKGVERAVTISARIRKLGFRAGYIDPPRPHEFRASSLLRVSKYHSEAERRKHAGQRDNGTYDKYYASPLAADGQGSYFHGESRKEVLERFQDMTICRNPSLLLALPAESLAELADSEPMKKLQAELQELQLRDASDPKTKKRINELYQETRRLKREATRVLQEQQSSAPQGTTPEPCYLRSLFDRVRYLMPERDRLSKALFQSALLRDPPGLEALGDLISLCRQDKEVEYRPGLEPQKCNCKGRQGGYNWKHVYNCYKKQQSSPTAFCFVCHEWVSGESEWTQHCSQHLEHPASIPRWCDPLTYAGVLAAPGLCPFCLGDESMPPESRMRQFIRTDEWRDHLSDCITRRNRRQNTCSQAHCSHPHCQGRAPFASPEKLIFHIYDDHGCIPSQSKLDFENGKRKREQEEQHGSKNKRTWRSRRSRNHPLTKQ